MAFGSLEIASIPRTQDYSVMKQNEDNKGAFQQMTLGQQSQKQSENRYRLETTFQGCIFFNIFTVFF